MNAVCTRRHTVPTHPLDFMPFMRLTPTGRVFWCPPLTVDYHQNYDVGRTFGWDMVALLRRPECDRSVLSSVARDMVRAGSDGHHDGAICGFMASIADAVAGRVRP